MSLAKKDSAMERMLEKQIIERLIKFKGQTLLRRAAMNVLVTHLAPREVKYLNDEFEKLDINQNGFLTYDEMKDAVKNSGFNLS